MDASGSVANIIQGLPGQFQVGYSKKNHKLFVPTVGARGGLASSLARVDADTLQTEAFAELPVKKNEMCIRDRPWGREPSVVGSW